MKFTWKIGNWLNRKKNQFSDFSDSYFSSYGRFSAIFCDVITPIFDDNSKNINLRILFIIFPVLYSRLPIIHKRLIKSEGGGLHILNWEKPIFWGVPTIFARCTHFSFKENIVLGWNQSSKLLPQKVVTDMRYFLLLRRCVEWLIRSDRGGATKTKQKRNMFNTVSDVVLSDLRNCYI